MWQICGKITLKNYTTVKKDSNFRTVFERKLLAKHSMDAGPVISVSDVISALSNQKCKKAPGPDGLHVEAFKFAGHRLCVSVLFDTFIRCSYIPHNFCQSILVPLVKCKTGDLTEVNNYRAIALSNAVTKILEHILFNYLADKEEVDDFQFGFKKRHSTADCTYAVSYTHLTLPTILRV